MDNSHSVLPRRTSPGAVARPLKGLLKAKQSVDRDSGKHFTNTLPEAILVTRNPIANGL